MAKKNKRFQVVHREAPEGGMMMETVILVDTFTGVLYLQVTNGYGGGLTPMRNRHGAGMVWDSEQQGTEELE